LKLVVFLNALGLGGTEKAACRWAGGLRQRGHSVTVLTLEDGPRRNELEDAGINLVVTPAGAPAIAEVLRKLSPDIIHAHVPGHPHQGDVLGEALGLSPKIPVLSTNVFGQLLNPCEDAWTDFRLFISWTSCVQAARRSFQPLNANVFRRASVAVYPVDPDDGPAKTDVFAFRQKHGIKRDEILFGRLSRPEPNKWTELALDAFRLATKRSPNIKLLLREPPPEVARRIENAIDRERFVILPTTSDRAELGLTMASLNVVLHTSTIGESFGYGIAEPMNYRKPVIANSTPWNDQAQLELVRHGETGLIASTAHTMGAAILRLAANENLREEFGDNARIHIRRLADPKTSLDRIENALHAAATGENRLLDDDLERAEAAAHYLDAEQFGHGWREQLALRPRHYRVRFHQWRHAPRR
jgi:glycosyltransferase involved in cell wall biosynthesis